MKMRSRSGQSILEYTLVLGAVIGVIVFVLLGGGDFSLKNRIKASYDKTSTAVADTNTDLGDHGIFKPPQ